MAKSRYNNFRVYKDDLNRLNYESFPSINIERLYSNSDIIVEIKDRQRIDTLATNYLGDGRYWWIICLYNNISFPFGEEIYPGRLIRIPSNINKVFDAITGGN